MTKILLTRVTVLGVGSTTPVSTTTTDETGASTTEQLPRTLLTLSLDPGADPEDAVGCSTGELAFGLLTDAERVRRLTRDHLRIPLQVSPDARRR